MRETYPDLHSRLRGELAALGKELPAPMAGFGQLHKTAMTEGVLSLRVKELMALAIAVGAHCQGCIAFHAHAALKNGASRAEILEALGVAMLMGGGPAVMYACEALEAVDQFQSTSR